MTIHRGRSLAAALLVAIASLAISSAACAQVGACCFGDKAPCEVLSFGDCVVVAGGFWLGPDTTCDECEPPTTGACCLPDGTCAILDNFLGIGEFICGLEGGAWLGDGSTCDMCLSTTAACCMVDGTCADVTPSACVVGDGFFPGPDVLCADEPCPSLVLGACCLSVGTCAISEMLVCEKQFGGVWQGAGTTCDECMPIVVNCCLPEGGCIITEAVNCLLAGGVPVDDCVLCERLTGACCTPNGCELLQQQFECEVFLEGTFAGFGSNCSNACDCLADINGDGMIGFIDLTRLLAQWGACASCPEDVNGDGAVGTADLTIVLGKWGPCLGR